MQQSHCTENRFSPRKLLTKHWRSFAPSEIFIYTMQIKYQWGTVGVAYFPQQPLTYPLTVRSLLQMVAAGVSSKQCHLVSTVEDLLQWYYIATDIQQERKLHHLVSVHTPLNADYVYVAVLKYVMRTIGKLCEFRFDRILARSTDGTWKIFRF